MLTRSIFRLSILTTAALLMVACESAAQGKNLIAERYLDNGDGTVTDITTKLTWRRCSVGQIWTGFACDGEAARFNWDDAMVLAKNGWRLPTVEELDRLVYCSSGQRKSSGWSNGQYVRDADGMCLGGYEKPTINQYAFPKEQPHWFWSSSSSTNYGVGAWGIHFGHGGHGVYGKENRFHARLVSAGQ